MSDKNFKVKSGLNIPITSAAILNTDSSGNISYTSVLPLSAGGTGQTSAGNALNALLPLQTGNTNYYLQTNGVTSQWNKINYQVIQDNGVLKNARNAINLIGFSFTDDSINDRTTISLSTNYDGGGAFTVYTGGINGGGAS